MPKISTQYTKPANLIPHFWFYRIIDKEGRPNLPCIIILSELFGWFRNLKPSDKYYSRGDELPELIDNKLAISYDFLMNKLHFERDRIRKNLIKLEELKIIKRTVKNVAIEGGIRFMQLYISIDKEFFESCFRDPYTDIRVGNDHFGNVSSSGNHSADFEDLRLLGREHISKKKKNRSIKSTFIKNNDNYFDDNIEDNKGEGDYSYKEEEYTESDIEEVDAHEDQQQNEDNSEYSSNPDKNHNGELKAKFPFIKIKQLSDFYPLSREDCDLLQVKSGREFSLNAMNEILLDMSKKLERTFFSKKGFISYMGKALKYELRDAVKISNESFRVNANKAEEEIESDRVEQYLREVESDRNNSPDTQMRKKLASVFVPDKAYQLLRACDSAHRKGNLYELNLSKYIKLSKRDKEIILNQARSVYERIDIEGNYYPITHLSILMPEYKENVADKYADDTNYKKSSDLLSRLSSSAHTPSTATIPAGIWGSIRKGLIDKYGAAIDQAWFDKLEAKIGSNKETIKLKAPSEFVKDWIDHNYRIAIETISSGYGLRVRWL